ncbi:uncharacterized protein LOC134777094 [Penaeus indicus]|uniref:uncharacterized protein LOC134777094 n=1 Tax=Penaeus indicus TaxID=29960 RepID=UPI00300C4ECB
MTPSITSTGPSTTTTPATTSATRRPVTATALRGPTTCSSPTAASRPSSTSWTATPATWLRSTTRARHATTRTSLGKHSEPDPRTPLPLLASTPLSPVRESFPLPSGPVTSTPANP